jgi:hypothetical protein
MSKTADAAETAGRDAMGRIGNSDGDATKRQRALGKSRRRRPHGGGLGHSGGRCGTEF